MADRRASARRQRAESWGRLAETLAAAMLTLKGYRIRAQRFRSPSGEVDLIASKGDMLVFVEVKARKTHPAARESVTFGARRRIERAAGDYLRQAGYRSLPICRFDIVTVTPGGLKHFPMAWGEGE